MYRLSSNIDLLKSNMKTLLTVLVLVFTMFFTNVLSADGLTGKYYNNDNFTDLKVTRVDSTINFEWDSGSPDGSIGNDSFSVEWTGYIYFPEAASYTFSLAHDDEVILTIGGTEVYNNSTWTGGKNNFVSASSVSYTEGYYPVTIRFIEHGGGAYMKLAWQNSGTISSRTIIPSTNLFTTTPNTQANDDSFNTQPDVSLTGNVFNNDSGTNIVVINKDTSTLTGTLDSLDDNTGEFTYTPPAGYTGNTSFTYTIQGQDGLTSTATVNITVQVITTYDGKHDFELVNPEATRNIRGDYKIAGNSMLCLTDETNTWGSACIDNLLRTSNQRMAEYIDIDSDDSTWNSSSSYINLPASYDQQGGNGIKWAGLFWSGRISVDNDYKKRMGVVSGATYTKIDMQTETAFDIQTLDANKIKLKVDSGIYNEIKAYTLYDTGSTRYDTYSAYADVTSYLVSANMGVGKHTFTVANLTHTEGREGSPGMFGGWSLVVIYAEDIDGKARNISVYNGLTVLSDNNTYSIKGFKLPNSGTVQAGISVFSGEGEYIYGDGSNEEDWMKLSRVENGPYSDMPGATDPTNMFEGRMTNILRDDVAGHANNQINNNVGVEVDDYDVSALMTTYRVEDPDIDEIFITFDSNQDYVTPTMMVFSTELYQPKICYEYTMDIDGSVIESENNDVNTSFQDVGFPLTTQIMIRSMEGDFDLNDAKMTIITEPNYLTYVTDSAQYQRNDTLDFDDVYPPQINNINATDSKFTINFGDGAGADGGILRAYETHFVKFSHDFNDSQDPFNTHMQMIATFTTDFGSGPVPVTQNLDVNDKCEGSHSYTPEWGIFNIIDAGAPDNNTYNLLTQVTDRNFSIKAVGYEADYVTPKNYDTNIELEVFDVEYYPNDVNRSCLYAGSSKSDSFFLNFNNENEKITTQKFPIAQRNAGFRIYILVDDTGVLVNHYGNSPGDDSYYDGFYDSNYKALEQEDRNCSAPFDTTNNRAEGPCTDYGSGCYSCIRKYWGKPICSRDNFSIRPETFSVALTDDKQGTLASVNIGHNEDTVAKNITGGYAYHLDINATNYKTNIGTKGYVGAFGQEDPSIYPIDEDKNHTSSIIPMFGNSALDMADQPCNNINNEGFAYGFFNGQKKFDYTITVRDVGEYKYHMLDNKWTAIDNPGNFGQDCTIDASTVNASGMVGCNISSEHNTDHHDLHLRSYPYAFNILNVQMSTPSFAQALPTLPPVAAAAVLPYIYSNNLSDDFNVAPYNADKNMSIRFRGAITAVGANRLPMTNFVNQCYANNLSVTLAATATGNVAAIPLRWREAGLARQIVTDPTVASGNAIVQIDKNTGLPLIPLTPLTYRTTGGAIVGASDLFITTTAAGTDNFDTSPAIGLIGNNFVKLDNGSGNLDLYLNYSRGVSAVHNPININIDTISVGCLANACQATANADNTYTPEKADLVQEARPLTAAQLAVGDGNGSLSWKAFDQNVMVYYTRAHVPRTRVAGNQGSIQTFYEVYCDLTTGCNLLDLAPLQPVQSVDSLRWYRNTVHTAAEGNVDEFDPFGNANTSTRIQTQLVNFAQIGVNPQVNVGGFTTSVYQYGGNSFPYKATITYLPNSYLVYNRFDATAIFNEFELEFDNFGNWSGIDNSGTKTDTNANINTNRRIQW